MKIRMRVDDFKRGMAAASKNVAVKKDAQARPILARVCMRVYNLGDESGNVEMVSMDGYVLACTYLPCGVLELGEEDAKKDFYEYLIEPVTPPRGANFITIWDDEQTIWIEFDEASTLKQKKLKGKYLDYPRVMKAGEPEFKIAFSPKYLERTIQACKGENVVMLSFYGDDKPLQIDGEHIRALCSPVLLSNTQVDGIKAATRNRMENHR